MSTVNDPRATGFNYSFGCPEPKPAIYHTGEIIAHILRQQANEIGRKAWALDEALRKIRVSANDAEMLAAAAELQVKLMEYLPEALAYPQHIHTFAF